MCNSAVYYTGIITCANFGEDRLRGLGVAGGQSLPFSIDFDRRPYNTFALPRECVIITFHVSRRRREMYCAHARLCVCLSAAACLHYCRDPDVAWGVVGDAPQLCSIGRICNRCTGCVAMATLEMRGRAQR